MSNQPHIVTSWQSSRNWLLYHFYRICVVEHFSWPSAPTSFIIPFFLLLSHQPRESRGRRLSFFNLTLQVQVKHKSVFWPGQQLECLTQYTGLEVQVPEVCDSYPFTHKKKPLFDLYICTVKIHFKEGDQLKSTSIKRNCNHGQFVSHNTTFSGQVRGSEASPSVTRTINKERRDWWVYRLN